MGSFIAFGVSLQTCLLGRGGGGVRGGQLTSSKTQHICLTNCITERNKYPSYLILPEIRFGWGNKGDVHRALLYDSKQIGTANAIVHYFVLPGGAT